MLKDDIYVDVPVITQKMKKYYQGLGYNIDDKRYITVKQSDLTPGSKHRIYGNCDECGKEISCNMFQYCRCSQKHNGRYLCVSCASRDKERMDKIKHTNFLRYGYYNPMQNTTIQQRQMDNFLSNGGKIPTSIPEQQLIDAIRNLGYLCVDGLTVGKYFPDGVLFYKDLKIDIEYDGIYWHSNKSNKDDIRDLYFLENGYKIFRVKANKGIPDDQQISEALNQLIYNDRYYYELYI